LFGNAFEVRRLLQAESGQTANKNIVRSARNLAHKQKRKFMVALHSTQISIKENQPWTGATAKYCAEQFIPILEKDWPEYIEEMKG
jgi:hypothetical protein